MSTITTGDGTQIFYKDWGTGPVVLFSHGWPLSADSWEAQMLFLAGRGYRCIAHDRRGHGRSTQTWGGNDMDTYADDLAAVIETLDLNAVALIGFSAGGGEVARYIGRHGTRRVAKAALIAAVAPLMLKTAANPGGLPLEKFDAIRAGCLADRSQFYRDLASGPFFGANRPGAESHPDSQPRRGEGARSDGAGMDTAQGRLLFQSAERVPVHRQTHYGRLKKLDMSATPALVRHYQPRTFGDRAAFAFIRFLRFFADTFFARRYGHRAVVLETVAAVPGMVGGSLQHLRALRRMKSDHGRIRVLLDEAENERMHLMTFIQIAQPSPAERLLIVLAQGVFYNAFFLLYLVSPRTAHRFVGYLEEEAIVSYTDYLSGVNRGSYANVPAPAIAIDYWRLAPDALLSDVIIAVRNDEAHHRDVNHGFASELA